MIRKISFIVWLVILLVSNGYAYTEEQYDGGPLPKNAVFIKGIGIVYKASERRVKTKAEKEIELEYAESKERSRRKADMDKLMIAEDTKDRIRRIKNRGPNWRLELRQEQLIERLADRIKE